MPRDVPELTAETLVMAYAAGVFPMAEARDDPEVFWVDPRERGVLPLDGFRLSRSLARTIRRGRYAVTLDRAFDAVVAGCADRDETWINAPLRALYADLHAGGVAHSVEVWEDGRLVGGVFGLALGRAWFGESMFSRARDASKVALAYLVAMLRRDGFALFDTQFLTDHLASLGAVEIPRRDYRVRLALALVGEATISGPVPEAAEVLALRPTGS